MRQFRLFSTASRRYDPKVDYYKLLDLRPGASEAAIKKGFYNMAKKYHPDSSDQLNANTKTLHEERFKQISAAYEILMDQSLREAY